MEEIFTLRCLCKLQAVIPGWDRDQAQERRGRSGLGKNKRGVKQSNRGCSGEDQRRRAGSGSHLWSQGCLWLPWPSLHRCPSVWTAVLAPRGQCWWLGSSRGSPGQPGACVWSGLLPSLPEPGIEQSTAEELEMLQKEEKWELGIRHCGCPGH